MAPETLMALRTSVPPAPERMLERNPRGEMARKAVIKKRRQRWMVLQRMVLLRHRRRWEHS